MKSKRGLQVLFAVLLVLVLLSLPLLAACGEKEPAVEKGQYGGILRYSLRRFPAGYDVHRKPSYGPFLSLPIFNNLLRYDPSKASISPADIEGDLAKSWDVSDDGKLWTFKLHKGVKWHDGQPFTADDVVYSLEKIVDAERSSLAGELEYFDRAEKVDDYTVKVYLKETSPAFFAQLANGYMCIQAKHLAGVDWQSVDFLVGTGPFKVKEIQKGISIELERNPDYFREGLPYLDGLKIAVIKDRSAQITALAADRLDMMTPGISINNMEQQKQVEELAPNAVVEIVSGAIGFNWFNHNYEPFKDVRVRKALNLLSDQEQLALVTVGSTDWRILHNQGFLSTRGGFGLSAEEMTPYLMWDKSFEERIVEAKKLMKEAGYADGFELKMPIGQLPEFQRGGIWLADQLKRHLNIEVITTVHDNAEIWKMRDAGDFHIISPQYLVTDDPTSQLSGWITGNPANFCGYSNPEVDRLYYLQAKEMDIQKRIKICQDIERILLADLPGIVASTSMFKSVRSPRVKGFVQSQAIYAAYASMELVWLE